MGVCKYREEQAGRCKYKYRGGFRPDVANPHSEPRLPCPALKWQPPTTPQPLTKIAPAGCSLHFEIGKHSMEPDSLLSRCPTAKNNIVSFGLTCLRANIKEYCIQLPSVLLFLRFHQITCLTLSLPGFSAGQRQWVKEIWKSGSGWNLLAWALITIRYCHRNLLPTLPPCLLSTSAFLFQLGSNSQLKTDG